MVLPSDCNEVMILVLQGHYSVCKLIPNPYRQTSHSAKGQQKQRLLNEHALDKMEVKEKAHGMQAADWMRFEDRWNL